MKIVPHQAFTITGDILTGHFREKRGYRCYRPTGTSDWLLIYTAAGGGLLRYGPQHTQSLPSQMMLFAPHAHHYYQTDPHAGQWELLWAHFHPRPHWMDLLRWPSLWPGLMRLTVADPGQARRLVEALMAMHALAVGGRARSQALAMNTLEEILLHLDEINPAVAGNRVDARIKNAMDTLFQAISQPTSIALLAKAAGLSESRFAHLFKSQIGVSPREFLEQQRVNRARDMLTLTQHSIKQIAAEVGFASPFYFSLRFKHCTGLSPLAYRRRFGSGRAQK